MKVKLVLVGSLSEVGSEIVVAEDRHVVAGIGCRSNERANRAGGGHRWTRACDINAARSSIGLKPLKQIRRRVILDLDIGIVFLRLRGIAMQ